MNEDFSWDYLINRCFIGLAAQEEALLTHGDSVSKAAEGFTVTATSGDTVAAICSEQRRIYGVQFHPEVDLTPNGKKIFRNFLYDVCSCSGSFTLSSREHECIEYIRNAVGSSKVSAFFQRTLMFSLVSFLLQQIFHCEHVCIYSQTQRFSTSFLAEWTLQCALLCCAGPCRNHKWSRCTLTTDSWGKMKVFRWLRRLSRSDWSWKWSTLQRDSTMEQLNCQSIAQTLRRANARRKSSATQFCPKKSERLLETLSWRWPMKSLPNSNSTLTTYFWDKELYDPVNISIRVTIIQLTRFNLRLNVNTYRYL